MWRALLFDPDAGGFLQFENPQCVLTAHEPADVRSVLDQVEQAAQAGAFAVGFVTYEAASAFDPALANYPPSHLPLLQFAIFDEPTLVQLSSPSTALNLSPQISEADFFAAIARISSLQASGDTYQVNFTHPLTGELAQEPLALFAAMYAAQPSPYSALIASDETVICSVSPELFFERVGQRIFTEPMKGTRPRGRYLDEDQRISQALLGSAKDRAENLMIVDMLRNDLGRIAVPGTVTVDELFTLRRYPTVWQQVSSISATSNASLSQLFAALFPCASVTGAPKARTMEIIRELELGPRGVYTGAIGLVKPGGDARFSVAIRTLVADPKTSEAVYGVGGGIVWDSDPADEWQESLLKGSLLAPQPPEFRLLETMRYEPVVGVHRLAQHLLRLQASASYFGYSISETEIRVRLDQLDEIEPKRLRLLLSADGAIELQVLSLPEAVAQVRLRMATTPVRSDDIFLFHKTTHRRVYEQARTEAGDCDDVILWNEKGELTETTIANLFLQIDGKLVTPPVDAGLLAGTLRQHLLETGEATTKRLVAEDLGRASAIYVGNSLRGLIPAHLVT